MFQSVSLSVSQLECSLVCGSVYPSECWWAYELGYRSVFESEYPLVCASAFQSVLLLVSVSEYLWAYSSAYVSGSQSECLSEFESEY